MYIMKNNITHVSTCLSVQSQYDLAIFHIGQNDCYFSARAAFALPMNFLERTSNFPARSWGGRYRISWIHFALTQMRGALLNMIAPKQTDALIQSQGRTPHYPNHASREEG